MTADIDFTDDGPWQIHLQTLRRQFYEEAGDRYFLWVNPAQGDPFAGDALVEERRVRVPIHHANFDVTLRPILFLSNWAKAAMQMCSSAV